MATYGIRGITYEVSDAQLRELREIEQECRDEIGAAPVPYSSPNSVGSMLDPCKHIERMEDVIEGRFSA